MVYFKVLPFFSHYQKLEGVFLQYLLWEPDQALGGKFHRFGGPPVTGSPWSLWPSELSMLMVWKFLTHVIFETQFDLRGVYEIMRAKTSRLNTHNNSKPKFNKYSHNMTIKQDCSRWGIWKQIEKREIRWWGGGCGIPIHKGKSVIKKFLIWALSLEKFQEVQ